MVDLFHITTRAAWEAAQSAGEYRAPSLLSEGFIHLSKDRQWLGAANRFFRGQRDLLLLALRADRLRAPVKLERADGDDFPHLYGALNLDAVIEVFELPVDPAGAIGVPSELVAGGYDFVRN